MKKILLGFIAIGLLTFVGCDKGECCGIEYEENETTGSTETSSAEAKDADGYTYKTVIIGEQEWFAENLRTTKYSDGTSIPNVTNDTEWTNNTIGAWCHYDNDSDYESTYGKLYNWYAVETGKLCPTGWHVPTDEEWTVLTDYLTANGHSGTEGAPLKATSGWNANGNGTDYYGWNGLPGGWRSISGNFGYVGDVGSWWSSSESSSSNAWDRNLSDHGDDVGRNPDTNEEGGSVRCVKD